MKTQEEIEKLAEQYLQKHKDDFDNWKEMAHSKITYVDAYNQSQEDHKDKKYTYEDMKRAFFSGNVMRDIDEFNCFLTTI